MCIILISPYIIIFFILVTEKLKEIRLELNQLNRKTGFLELKNYDQDREIHFLKTIISNLVKPTGDDKMQNGNDESDDGVIMVRNKRPASLIHLEHNSM